MPLGVIKFAENIQTSFFFAESEYSGPPGFFEKLAAGIFSARNHMFALNFLAVPWKEENIRPLWENDT